MRIGTLKNLRSAGQMKKLSLQSNGGSKQRIYVPLWYNSHITDAKTTHPCIAGRLENKSKNDDERLLDSIIYAKFPMRMIISGS